MAAALEPMERAAAAQRQSKLNGKGSADASGKIPEASKGNASDKIAAAVGMSAPTLADKRRSIQRLVEDAEWSKWSDRENAKRCGVHHQMVATMRPATSLDESSSERSYTTRHGTTATMNTANIGRGPWSTPGGGPGRGCVLRGHQDRLPRPLSLGGRVRATRRLPRPSVATRRVCLPARRRSRAAPHIGRSPRPPAPAIRGKGRRRHRRPTRTGPVLPRWGPASTSNSSSPFAPSPILNGRSDSQTPVNISPVPNVPGVSRKPPARMASAAGVRWNSFTVASLQQVVRRALQRLGQTAEGADGHVRPAPARLDVVPPLATREAGSLSRLLHREAKGLATTSDFLQVQRQIVGHNQHVPQCTPCR